MITEKMSTIFPGNTASHLDSLMWFTRFYDDEGKVTTCEIRFAKTVVDTKPDATGNSVKEALENVLGRANGEVFGQ